MTNPQRYANHRRWSPLWHFFVLPILCANVAAQLTMLTLSPSLGRAWTTVVAAAILGVGLVARYMALVVQNRVIRLEERLRLFQLLPEDLRSRVYELDVPQLVGLRFASDEELPALVRRCLTGELQTKDAIKKNIQNWRADHVRV